MALEWVKPCPDSMPGEESGIENRPYFEAGDFGAEFTPKLRAQEEELRKEVERQQQQAAHRPPPSVTQWHRRAGRHRAWRIG